ncbi:MAG TPA: chromosome segregation protein SMC, partial [Desulfobacterales bacterium]|nr:chromosome segregation protein SMC [Desulfobacterales bacterium]
KADYRIVEEEQKGLQNQLQRLRAYLAEATERLEKIDGEIQEAREKQFSYEEEKKHVALLIEDLREDVEMAAATLQSAERDRQELQTSVKELENKLDQARKELSDLKETISRAKMEGSEIQIRMNSLADMAREKYGVDLPGLYQGLLMEQFSEAELRQEIEQKKQLKQKLGEVNLAAIKEHEALKERHEFIKTQREDLITSIESLRKAIRKINKTSLEKFQETFRQVDEKLKTVFPILFNGGTAGLKLTDESRPLESGVLVEVQPPGKKLSHMGLLSGGEKALVAMALLFSIYLIKPSPFCLLDEVDAPLDEANIDRFNELLKEIKKSSQIILVTHNRKTMEIADRLYGVTMEEAGISKIVSVDIERVKTETQQEAPSAC